MIVSDTKIVPTADRFDIDADNSSGLTLRVRGGIFLDGTGLRSAPNVTLTLTASATNYVEMSDPGVISTNTTGFTAGYTELYIITTGATVITGVQDFRHDLGDDQRAGWRERREPCERQRRRLHPVWHRIDLAAGALADTDVVLTHKTRIIDAFLILRGAGVSSTTLQVKNGASAITNAMAASGSDQALVRAATIDDAAYEIAAGGTLRVTSASGATQPAASVYVLGLRVA
jgi:hypothetical protein